MYEKAKNSQSIVAYADGENETILRAVQTVVDDGLARPLLVGRPDVIELKIRTLGLRLRKEDDFDCFAPEANARYARFVQLYHELMCRKGVSKRDAHEIVRSNNTVIASLLLRDGVVDSMLCGMVGEYRDHLRHIEQIVAPVSEDHSMSSVSALVLRKGTFFISDAYVHAEPTVDQLVEGTLLAAEQMRRFGIEPKVAFVSHSNFGKDNGPATSRLRLALARVKELELNLMVDGEMSASSALSPKSRELALGDSSLTGQANLLVMPNIDAANITLNLLTELGEGVSVGPILLGCSKPAHILDPTATVRGVINMSALAVAEAESLRSKT
jgi:malate dehydrogenase (oxaloacetate-decarboxylating)(NADP+)